jgi:hypothetical protein
MHPHTLESRANASLECRAQYSLALRIALGVFFFLFFFFFNIQRNRWDKKGEEKSASTLWEHIICGAGRTAIATDCRCMRNKCSRSAPVTNFCCCVLCVQCVPTAIRTCSIRRYTSANAAVFIAGKLVHRLRKKKKKSEPVFVRAKSIVNCIGRSPCMRARRTYHTRATRAAHTVHAHTLYISYMHAHIQTIHVCVSHTHTNSQR